jgi:GNAT superfamily N-acetyltransferase
MADFTIRPVNAEDKEWIRRLMQDHWAAEFVVVHGTVFHPHELPGFIAETGGNKSGLITYRLEGPECEIVTLDSLVEFRGIGSALIEAVERQARRAGCRRLLVVTTNDNLPALRFYQRRGFVLAALRPNALQETRKLKPVPPTGMDGIPIRDELELARTLE